MKSRGKGGRIRVVAIPVWVMQDSYARTSAVGSVKTHSSKKQEVKTNLLWGDRRPRRPHQTHCDHRLLHRNEGVLRENSGKLSRVEISREWDIPRERVSRRGE
jgi:hypothetical protein